MLGIGKQIRFRLAAILLLHWKEFVSQHRKWIRPVVFETVRKIIACRTPALGCHVYDRGRGAKGLTWRFSLLCPIPLPLDSSAPQNNCQELGCNSCVVK